MSSIARPRRRKGTPDGLSAASRLRSASTRKLKAAGVKVQHVDYPTMVHGFFSMEGWLPLAHEAIAAAAKAAKEALD